MSETSTDTTSPAPADDAGASAELKALLDDINGLSGQARAAFDESADLKALEEARLRFLGKKGILAELNQRFGKLSGEERPIAGKVLNNHKAQIIHLEKARRETLEAEALQQRLASESIDVTLPGVLAGDGHLHPITQTRRQVERIFRGLGFQVSESPEIETEWMNFEALNFAPDHPARDMQDTFFVERGRVLRTHTSPNQIRTMLGAKPPLAVISAGKVYRCDSDVTHSPMFFQMEGFMVGKNISMGHLKGVLEAFVHGLYGAGVGTRFRPSFFPFTEPSAEVDVACVFCKGSGCRVCSNSGWLEILGCGMIHPNVLSNCGIDPEVWSGFAFGMGIDRIAMLKYGISDIRLLYENDLRFLTQF
jgi:phenylalanyl-tRNA synthetase alpha chain